MNPTSRTLRIATRKSALALWQANTVKALLESAGFQVELNLVVTTGDKMQRGALAEISLDAPHLPDHLKTGKGLFVKEVQEEILQGKADLAVHSMKDLPVETTSGLRVSAVLPRAHAGDVIIFSPNLLNELRKDLQSEPLEQTPDKIINSLCRLNWSSAAPIGTTSARRQCFLRSAIRTPDLPITVLRGNVDTRLRRVRDNEFSFIMLARAGIDRLKLFESASMLTLPTELSLPAPAQGIVAIECRDDDDELRSALNRLNEPNASLAAALERTTLWLTGGDCHTAFAAYFADGRLSSWAAGPSQRATFSHALSASERNTWEQRSRTCDHASLQAELLRSDIAKTIHAHLISSGYDKLMTLRSAQF